ncbi:3-methylmercaptopropionyl-CoA dehydrogenase (DmdC), partial [hydrothermal vent metagenome]
CYETARALDLAEHLTDEVEKSEQAALAALLTPIAKAFGTDIGSEVASLGVQVHGGMGYIEETGAAQHLRDVRITQIYEGTNGIQALDLISRKLPLGNGEVVLNWLVAQGKIADSLTGDLTPVATHLKTAISQLETATATMLERVIKKDEKAEAAATTYLRAFALVAGTAAMAKGAEASRDTKRVQLVRYFAANHLVKVGALVAIIEGGAGDVLDSVGVLG